MAKKSHSSGERKLGQMWRSRGIRNQPEDEPGTAEMADGNNRADGKGEDGDGFGAARDRAAPSGVGQAQDGGDQRAGMADADPENEIGDVESPEYRRVQPPDADAVIDLIAEGEDAGQDHAARHSHGKPVRGRWCARAAAAGPRRICSAVLAIVLARTLAEGNLRWAWCRVRRAAWCRGRNAPGAKPRYWDRSDRRRPWPWEGTIARRRD